MSSYKERALRARLAGEAGDIATDDVFLVRNYTPNPLEADYTQQEYATGEEGASLEEPRNARTSFSFEVDGGWGSAAGTAPRIAPLLRACGMAETINAATSVTYSPQGAGEAFAALECQLNNAGQVQVPGDVRGSLSFTARSGERPFFSMNYLGRYDTPVAAVWPTPDYYTGWVFGPLANPSSMQTFTIGGVPLCITELTWSDGRTPRVDKYMNCPGVDITQRRFTGRAVARLPDLATKAIIEEAKLGVTGALLWEINAENPDHGAMRMAAPRVQAKFGGLVDIEGDMGLNLDLTMLPDQGGDDLSIIFKAQE